MKFIFYSSQVIPLIEAARKNNLPILFVRDQGVYLMVGIDNADNIVCYAKNCNPDIDEDWYFNCKNSKDGDDFGEEIDANDEIFDRVIKLKLNLEITLEQERYIVRTVRGG